MRAFAPGLADVGRSQRTTVASTNGSPRRWRSAASARRSSLIDTLVAEQPPDLGWRDRDVDVANAQMPERVHDGVGDGHRRAHGRRLADALGAERVVGRRRARLVGLPVRRLHRGRYEVVDEAAALDVADLVVGDLFVQCRRQPHGQPAVNLALDDHGVDDVAAIVDGDEAPDLHFTGALVDVHDGDVAAERIGQVRRIVIAHGLEPGFHPLRVVRIRGERDVLDGLERVGRALDRELAGLPHQILGRGLEQMRRDLPRLVLDLARGHCGGGASHRSRPAGLGAEAIGRGVSVALFDLDVFRGNAELLGQDLSVRRLVALALRLRPEARDRLARRVDTDLTGVEHLESEDVEVLRGPGADDLGEARDADAHQFAALALLGLLALQLGVADAIHRLLERRAVVAAVVFPPER